MDYENNRRIFRASRLIQARFAIDARMHAWARERSPAAGEPPLATCESSPFAYAGFDLLFSDNLVVCEHD